MNPDVGQSVWWIWGQPMTRALAAAYSSSDSLPVEWSSASDDSWSASLLLPAAWVFERTFPALQSVYVRMLGAALRHRFAVLVLATVVGAGAVALWPRLGSELVPPLSRGEFTLAFEEGLDRLVEVGFPQITHGVPELLPRTVATLRRVPQGRAGFRGEEHETGQQHHGGTGHNCL